MKQRSKTFHATLLALFLLIGSSVSVSANVVTNAFVIIDGPGVERVDGKNFAVEFPEGQDAVEITLTPLPGWQLLTPRRMTVRKGASPEYKLVDDSKEQDANGDVWRVKTYEKDDHLTAPKVGATIALNVGRAYAAPDKGAVATVSGSAATISPGKHKKTRYKEYYKNDVFQYRTSPEEEEYGVCPESWSWTYSPKHPGTANGQSFTSDSFVLTKGTHAASGTVTASRACSKCNATAAGADTKTVSILSVGCTKWIGLDRTGVPSSSFVSPPAVAQASLVEGVPGVDKVNWAKESFCSMETSGWNAVLRTNNRDKGSSSYGAEKVSASAAGATATTNFTVVKVDVTIGNLNDETKEETTGAFIAYSPKSEQESFPTEFDLYSEVGTPVKITCEPDNLPDSEMIAVSCSGPGVLYECTPGDEAEPGEYRRAKQSYPANEIGSVQFYLLGSELAGNGGIGTILVSHAGSGAKDRARYSVAAIKLQEASAQLYSGPHLFPDVCGNAQLKFKTAKWKVSIIPSDLQGIVYSGGDLDSGPLRSVEIEGADENGILSVHDGDEFLITVQDWNDNVDNGEEHDETWGDNSEEEHEPPPPPPDSYEVTAQLNTDSGTFLDFGRGIVFDLKEQLRHKNTSPVYSLGDAIDDPSLPEIALEPVGGDWESRVAGQTGFVAFDFSIVSEPASAGNGLIVRRNAVFVADTKGTACFRINAPPPFFGVVPLTMNYSFLQHVFPELSGSPKVSRAGSGAGVSGRFGDEVFSATTEYGDSTGNLSFDMYEEKVKTFNKSIRFSPQANQFVVGGNPVEVKCVLAIASGYAQGNENSPRTGPPLAYVYSNELKLSSFSVAEAVGDNSDFEIVEE